MTSPETPYILLLLLNATTILHNLTTHDFLSSTSTSKSPFSPQLTADSSYTLFFHPATTASLDHYSSVYSKHFTVRISKTPLRFLHSLISILFTCTSQHPITLFHGHPHHPQHCHFHNNPYNTPSPTSWRLHSPFPSSLLHNSPRIFWSHETVLFILRVLHICQKKCCVKEDELNINLNLTTGKKTCHS